MKLPLPPALLAAALLTFGCHDVTGPDQPMIIDSPALSHAGTGAGFHATGSIGTGAAAPNSSRQDFAFDLSADLRTATLSYTDWSIVRADGDPLTVDVLTSDAFAGIVTFRDGSAACTEPARGAEFDGWGRIDRDGGLVPFTVAACDNGAAGSGVDFFRITLREHGYQREGPVTSGDVVKSGALPPPANPRVTGLGWFPPGRPTPESYGKHFDFEATAAPGGRLAYTDHEAVRPDGSRGGITVNSATDPATGVTSYQQMSSTCVRFGGMGRIDTGELAPFWVDVCDNASPGTGQDTFGISVPNLFKLGGTLTDGDIVLGASAPSTGGLSVTATTTGESLDSDGYTATVDGTTSQPLAANGSATFTGLSVGSHTVVLSGVATNCTVSGGNSQTVSVTAGGTASAAFSVSCAALTGNLSVTATTTGGTHDSDGYTVTVDGSTGQHLPTNGGSVTFSGLSAGDHTVALSGVAAHCTVTDGASRTISVPAGGTASTAFAVSCAQLTGDLTVNVSTSGVSLDPDGYMITLDGSNPRTVPINGSTTYTSLPNGNYAVSISGLAANCKLTGDQTRIVAVPAGGAVSTSYSVTCEPGPATRLAFTVQPSDTKVNSTIQPPVQVTAFDAQGNRATSFNGSVTIAIGRNGGGLLPGTLSGTRTVSAVNGVATFSDLRIDRAGDYTLRVTSSGLTGAESQTFRIQNLVCLLGLCL